MNTPPILRHRQASIPPPIQPDGVQRFVPVSAVHQHWEWPRVRRAKKQLDGWMLLVGYLTSAGTGVALAKLVLDGLGVPL